MLELETHQAKKLILQMIVQAIRDYISRDNASQVCSSASIETAKLFLFNEDYRLHLGYNKYLSLEEMLEIIAPEGNKEILIKIRSLET